MQKLLLFLTSNMSDVQTTACNSTDDAGTYAKINLHSLVYALKTCSLYFLLCGSNGTFAGKEIQNDEVKLTVCDLHIQEKLFQD